MKRFLFFAVAVLMLSPVLMARMRKEPPKAPEQHINWISMDELQVRMKEKPKRVYMDMYTDWCGWCKKMEATTFTNPDVIKFMNENFYCVRFNCERKDTLHFMGKDYYFDPAKKANTLALQLMNGQMSYPTSIFMDPYYQNVMPAPGYQDVKGFELLVRFFCEVKAKSQEQWESYQKTFVPTWGMSGPVTPDYPPMGH